MASMMLTSKKDAETKPKILLFLLDKIHNQGGNTSIQVMQNARCRNTESN